MAGTRIPSNAAPSDSAISAVSDQRVAALYADSAQAAQALYSELWQDMRNYFDNYCNVPGSQHSSAPTSSSLTEFSPSLSTQSTMTHQTYTFPRNMDGTVSFPNLGNAGSDSNPINLDNDSGSIAPTIQFDLGSNLLSCSSQQSTLANFSAPYDYSTNPAVGTQVDSNQNCFANDSSLASTLWNLGNSFASPSNQSNLSSTNLDSVSTVDYTARWDLGNNLNSSPANQGSVGNNLQNAAEPYERRLRPFIREPCTAVEQKIEKALQQRLYMIDKKLVGDPQAPTACDYQVLGATGNPCTVRLSTVPSCTCPDPQRTCKHILFIMLRVLKLPAADYRIWQTALLTREVGPLLQKTLTDSDVLASQQVQQRFQEITNQALERSGEADGELQNLQGEVSGDCPVCFEMMGNQDGSAQEELSSCKVCGSNVHKDCFQRWSMSKQESGETVTCIFCRSMWFDDSLQVKKRKAASDIGQEGYGNLADYSSNDRAEDMTLEPLYPHVRPKLEREWRGC